MNITHVDNQMQIDTKTLFSFLSGSRQITLVKGGESRVTGSGWFGKALAPVAFPTASITAVRLMTYMDNQAATPDGGPVFGTTTANDQNRRRSRLVLQLATNDQIEVASKQSSGGLSVNGMNVTGLLQKAPLSDEAQQIATFLGVPLHSDDSSSLGGVIRSSVEAAPAPSVQPVSTPPAAPAPPQNNVPAPPVA